jgi:hypothetical protein
MMMMMMIMYSAVVISLLDCKGKGPGPGQGRFAFFVFRDKALLSSLARSLNNVLRFSGLQGHHRLPREMGHP